MSQLSINTITLVLHLPFQQICTYTNVITIDNLEATRRKIFCFWPWRVCMIYQTIVAITATSVTATSVIFPLQLQPSLVKDKEATPEITRCLSKTTPVKLLQVLVGVGWCWGTSVRFKKNALTLGCFKWKEHISSPLDQLCCHAIRKSFTFICGGISQLCALLVQLVHLYLNIWCSVGDHWWMIYHHWQQQAGCGSGESKGYLIFDAMGWPWVTRYVWQGINS